MTRPSPARARPESAAGGFEAAADVRWRAPTSSTLRDVAEATFGPPPVGGLETVIGTDERQRVADTTVAPFRSIASLLILAADNSPWIGTGWFISPRTLVTAGHCVFIHDPTNPRRHGWAKSISVMPGRDGERLPFGAATATEFHSVGGWTRDADANADYAAIVLPTPLGDAVGAIGFGVYPDDELRASTVSVAGYPGDKPTGTAWQDARAVAAVDAFKVYYDLDTAGGQSGAAVYRAVDGAAIAVAVHAYGTGGGGQSNSSTRINASVYANLTKWMR